MRKKVKVLKRSLDWHMIDEIEIRLKNVPKWCCFCVFVKCLKNCTLNPFEFKISWPNGKLNNPKMTSTIKFDFDYVECSSYSMIYWLPRNFGILFHEIQKSIRWNSIFCLGIVFHSIQCNSFMRAKCLCVSVSGHDESHISCALECLQKWRHFFLLVKSQSNQTVFSLSCNSIFNVRKYLP